MATETSGKFMKKRKREKEKERKKTLDCQLESKRFTRGENVGAEMNMRLEQGPEHRAQKNDYIEAEQAKKKGNNSKKQRVKTWLAQERGR